VTPTSFLELLAAYATILRSKRKSLEWAKNRLVRGLQVLEKAGTEIALLQEAIEKMTPDLERTKREVAATMETLAVEKADADAEREIVAKDEAEATQAEAEAETLKSEAELALGQATPLLEEAARVLASLRKDDFYVLQGIKKPTPTVVLGMEVSCHMMGIKPKKGVAGKVDGDTHGYFEAARVNLLSNPAQFLKSMQDYDKENIEEKVVKRVGAIIDSDDFTLEKVTSAASALVAILKWSAAMLKYHELLKIVNPKRAAVREMSEKLAVVRAGLAEKRKRLREVEEKIDGLERMFAEKKAQEASLQAQLDDSNTKLGRANKIIAGLAGEKTRWTETVARLTLEHGFLIGNCLVAAGMVAYAGAFTAQFRSELEAEWRVRIVANGLAILPESSMKGLLEDPVQTKLWTAASLPNDNLSIENGIIMFSSRRWPLMIDPQSQANKFVKTYGREAAEAGLDVFKMSDATLLRNLELAIQHGRWVLIENVGEELDPALEPVLLKQVDKSGQLRLGDKSIPYSQSFKFLMTTTLPNPHYSPETSVKVTILNFAITPFGLEEQMLNQFVGQEMPELQKKKDNIVQQNALAAKSLVEAEDAILTGLTKNDEIAKILEDDELIVVLDESRRTSDEIKARLKESEETERDIDTTRELYRPVAYRASLLFFAIVDLAAIDPMYQYSLQWFANLFGSSIDNSAKASDAAGRIRALNAHFTLALYENVCRSLFEKHKLLFSLILTAKILFGAKALDPREWRYFLAGPSGAVVVPKNPTDWLGDLEWAEVYKQLHGAG
jgi:dynein heavy chain